MTDVLVRFDVYPATVRVGSSTMSGVRAVLGDDTFIALRNGGSMVHHEYESKVESISGGPETGWILETDLGRIVVGPGGGCRCGGGLVLNYDPWPGARRARGPR